MMVDPYATETLVQSLTAPSSVFYEYSADEGKLLKAAAARITALEAQVKRLKETEDNLLLAELSYFVPDFGNIPSKELINAMVIFHRAAQLIAEEK